jgi:4-alpha-glucanotransferase
MVAAETALLSGDSCTLGAPSLLVMSDGFIRREQLWRGAGLAIPVFSLRTTSSVGSGEFLDLIPLVDFAAAAGMHLLQLLPVNDTCVHGMWWDSYPYSSISVFALHPQYLSLKVRTSLK